MKFLSLAFLLLALAAVPAWAGDGDDVPSRFLDRYDANGDGRVTPDEIDVGAEVFRLLDRDGDGAITREDLGGPAGSRPRRGDGGQGRGKGGQGPGKGGPGADRGAERHRRLLEMDADGDGRITREEFKGPDEIFERLDANDDGAIDRAECDRAGHRGRPGGQGPGGQGPGGQGRGGQGPGGQGRGPGGGPGQGRGPGGRLLERLQELDTDGDGRVSAEEYEGRIPFERLDRNGDGFLDAQDFPGGRRGGRGQGRGPGNRPDPQRMREALKAMDTDGDGKVSKDEYTGPVPFERLDRNGDGFLDPSDAPRGPGQGPGQGPGGQGPGGQGPGRARGRHGRGLPPQALKRLDTDGDGEVSREEFPGSDERFDTLDLNGDGTLTEADLPKTPPPAPPKPPAPPSPPAPPPAPNDGDQ